MVSLAVTQAVGQNSWQLPALDPRNEKKYQYELHSLDIYFWTDQDALRFFTAIRGVLPPDRVEILEEPRDSSAISGIIRRLEDATTLDTQYTFANASLQDRTQRPFDEYTSKGVATSSGGTQSLLPPATFIPSYNPAAPAAPETLKHREKTPPPNDYLINPLAAAAGRDQEQPSARTTPPEVHHSSWSVSTGSMSSRLVPYMTAGAEAMPPAGVPGHQGVQGEISDRRPHTSKRSNSVDVISPASSYSGPSLPVSTADLPVDAGFLIQERKSRICPPSTTSESNYSFSARIPACHKDQDYSIHQQFYRPTESDFDAGSTTQYHPKIETSGRLEANAGRLERGISGVLKKFEKKFG